MTSPTSLTTILKTDTHGRVRTPAQERDAILAHYDQSALSGAEFARQHGLRYSTFMGWLRRRRTKETSTAPSGPALFQEVFLTAPSSCAEGLVVELPMGVRVRLDRIDQVPAVVVLSQHLHDASCKGG